MADISVPYWNIVDVNMLCEGARLIGFDLDNTLARSKKPMKADMAECFSALTSLIDVAVITGGKYSLLQSQVVDRLSDHADKSKLHLMPTSGTRYYRWDGQRWGKVFSHDLSDEDRAKAKESLERNAREQGDLGHSCLGRAHRGQRQSDHLFRIGAACPRRGQGGLGPHQREEEPIGLCGCCRTTES